MKRFVPALLILSLAACARSEEASLIPPDGNSGYNKIGTVSPPEDDDREVAIGQWRSALQEDLEVLEFGPIGTEPLFSLTCGPERSIVLQRHGGAAPGPLPEMEVTRGEATERLPVTAGAGNVPMLRAQAPIQSAVGQIVGEEGEPLVIRLGDAAPLILPASPLVGEYLRGCATGRPRTATVNSQAPAPVANSAAPAAAPAPAANDAQPKQ